MKQNKAIKPDWVPENAGHEFATTIVPGVRESNIGEADAFSTVPTNYIASHSATIPPKQMKKNELSVQELFEGICAGNRMVLAKAITLFESNSPKHSLKAQELLKLLMPHTGNSIRIGITGAPGAGKSTFIESFGSYLCRLGHKIAVLAIDPSSIRSKGSILGDKTRMETLSQMQNAFIRPSPSGGILGGVARKTRETILACEAAGFNVIIIETIGSGQSEITVRSMVDFFILVLLPGEGDELQGIKKGTVELADCLIINKADSDNDPRAMATRESYRSAVHYILPATEGWQTRVVLASALNHKGIDSIWTLIREFEENVKQSGEFFARRKRQLLEWMQSMLEEELLNRFYGKSEIVDCMPKIKNKLLNGEITPTNAVRELIKRFEVSS